MAKDREFNVFVEECRKVGLVDIKALEAAWEEYAALIPAGAAGAAFRVQLIDLLKLGAEYAQMLEAAGQEDTHV